MDLSKLHVVTMISNPKRYRARVERYNRFKQHMKDASVNLWTCEVAFGDRDFDVTQWDDPRALQLRTTAELWHKENALNLMVQRLPPDWEYVAWIDADIEFTNWRGEDSWFKETLHMLQHHRIVQLFQNAVDLGPKGELIDTHVGFGYSYRSGAPYKTVKGYGKYWHPGYAWAIRRETWDLTGGLIPWAIMGAADNHMAHAWIGKAMDSVNPDVSGPYFDKIKAYEDVCRLAVRKDIGFVNGTIKHFWHGKKKDRRYWDRWKVLTETQFDPNRDLRTDWQGLYALVDLGDERSIVLRDKARDYYLSRNEDSVDIE